MRLRWLYRVISIMLTAAVLVVVMVMAVVVQAAEADDYKNLHRSFWRIRSRSSSSVLRL